MLSISELKLASESAERLDKYLLANISGISQYSSTDYDHLCGLRFDLDDYVIEFANVIDQINLSKYYNSLFVLTLLEFSEILILPGSYGPLYRIATTHNLDIGKRHSAAKIFLLDIELKVDHLNRFDTIVELLQEAYETEEDNEVLVLSTFGNYFINAINNTAKVDISIVEKLVSRINQARIQYSFLSFELVDKIIAIKPSSDSQYINLVKQTIQKHSFVNDFKITGSNNFIIESDTDYARKLAKSEMRFYPVRKISMIWYNTFTEIERSKIRGELLRGVKIIDNEKQLYAYMTLYGKKHHLKLQAAFKLVKHLPEKYNIIDWGCGQGLASMVFLDTYGINSVQKILLNEPSELALSRASLHLSRYSGVRKITTVNKTIGDLNLEDINTLNHHPTMNLFSNILDISLDLSHLSSIIENSLNTDNYFFCVSPYINDLRTNRIDLFVDHLMNKFPKSYENIHSQDIKYADTTMVLRLFKISKS